MEKLNYAAAARAAVSSNASAASTNNNTSSTNQFNAGEASRFLQERWAGIVADLQNADKAEEEKPKVFVQPSTGKVWGQSKLPLQPAVGANFLAVLQDSLNNTQSPRKA